MPETVLFEESQRTSAGVLRAALGIAGAAIAVAAVATARQGKLGEAAPGLVLGAVVAIVVTGLVTLTRLDTRVTTAGAVIRYGPFKTLRLRADEIASVTTKTFGMFDGGIGYHVGFRSMALTATTGSGVVVTRADGYRILIGTRRPDALLGALAQLQRSAPGPTGAAR